MIRQDKKLLYGFFKTQKAEVTKMLLTEFNKELYEKNRYQEGLEDGRIENAKNFLAMNVLTLEQIAKGTGLPLEKIKELAAEENNKQ